MSKTTVSVQSTEEGLRLDRWFHRRYPSIGFGLIAKLLRKGAIKVNDKKSAISYRTCHGDKISFPESLSNSKERKEKRDVSLLTPAMRPLVEKLVSNIIDLDEHIVAFDKPRGIPAQGGTKNPYGLDRLVAYIDIDLDKAPAVVQQPVPKDKRPLLVHRLDKDVTGVIVMARNRIVASDMAKMFQERKTQKDQKEKGEYDSGTMHKEYVALCHNVPEQRFGTINAPLFKNKDLVVIDHEKGKDAETKYKMVLTRTLEDETVSLIAVTPITGRTHQLRVHLASIGCPIVGDQKYGNEYCRTFTDGIRLHSCRLGFSYKGKQYDITSPYPKNF